MQYAWLNGKWVSTNEDSIPSQDEGHGLFETICVRKGLLRFWDKHWARMTKSAQMLDIELGRTSKEILEPSRALIKKNKLYNGAIKLICHDKKPVNEWAIITREQSYLPEQYQKGFKIRLHPEARCLNKEKYGHKRINHTGPRIARKEAYTLGFDETLFVNESGFLCEGSYSNLFFSKGGELFTPAQSCGLLPGIARGEVLRWATERGIPTHEGQFTLEDLIQGDEVFVTNALAGAMPVALLETSDSEIAFDLKRAFISMELVKYFS